MRRVLLVAVACRAARRAGGACLDVARRRSRRPAVLLRSGSPVCRRRASRDRHRCGGRRGGACARGRNRDLQRHRSGLGSRAHDHHRGRARGHAHPSRLDRGRAGSYRRRGSGGRSRRPERRPRGRRPVPPPRHPCRLGPAGLSRPALVPARARGVPPPPIRRGTGRPVPAPPPVPPRRSRRSRRRRAGRAASCRSRLPRPGGRHEPGGGRARPGSLRARLSPIRRDRRRQSAGSPSRASRCAGSRARPGTDAGRPPPAARRRDPQRSGADAVGGRSRLRSGHVEGRPSGPAGRSRGSAISSPCARRSARRCGGRSTRQSRGTAAPLPHARGPAPVRCRIVGSRSCPSGSVGSPLAGRRRSSLVSLAVMASGGRRSSWRRRGPMRRASGTWGTRRLRAVRRVRALPPAQGQRRAGGERHRRARHAGDGGRRRGREVLP